MLVVLLMLFGSGQTAIFAQDITGAVVGTVSDGTGAVVAAATVRVTNAATGISATTRSDAKGNYSFTFLTPGLYTVRVEATGFQTEISANNEVVVGQSARVDLSLHPGAATQEVTVQANAIQADTTSSGQSQLLTATQVHDLPLNGRIFSQLVQTVPGAVPAGWTDVTESASGGGAQTAIYSAVNGLPLSGATYLLDGVNDAEPVNAFINIEPPVEAIQEVNVQTSNPNISYGVFGGAVVSVQVKSGTNAIHGSLFEFLKNDALNAKDYFSQTKPKFRSNQFGGALCGPLVKDRAFFFVDYQGLRLENGYTATLTVPTPNMLQGKFLASEGFSTIYDPITHQPFTSTSNPGQEWDIPQARWDSVSAKVVAAGIWPGANQPTGNEFGDYVTNVTRTQDLHQFDVKFDYQTARFGRFFARESFARRNFVNPPPGTAFIDIGDGNSVSSNHNAALGWTFPASANLVNELRIAYNRFDTQSTSDDAGTPYNNQFGIPNGNLLNFPQTIGIANFFIGPIAGTGAPGYINAQRESGTYQINEGLTLSHGQHTLRVGADFRMILFTLTNAPGSPRGQFNFDANYTSNGAGFGGDAWASFLLGYPQYVERDILNTRPGNRILIGGVYVGDDYKVSPKLTLNLGLRWDVITPQIERSNRLANFSLADGLLHTASSSHRTAGLDTYFGNVAPRVGFAYTPDRGQTAFRGAFGMSYFNDNAGATGGTLEYNYPFAQSFDYPTPTPFVPFRTLSGDGLPGFVSTTPAATYAPPAGLNPSIIPSNMRPDVAEMWNIGVQRQVSSKAVADIAYVGTHGVHLFRTYDINQPDPGPGNLNLRRPYYSLDPQLGSITFRGPTGNSRYDSLQTSLNYRAAPSLLLNLAYTWSKNLNDLNVFFTRREDLNRAVSTNFYGSDYPHVFSATYTYQLPFGRNRKFLSSSNALVDGLAGGWSLNGINTIHSGVPLDLSVAASQLNTGTGNRPDHTCSSTRYVKSVTEWFDPACFTAPAAYDFGNTQPGFVRGPGINNTDLSLFKDFMVFEKVNLEFRSEFFNAFNNKHLGNPDTTLNANTAGTSANDLGVIHGTQAPNRQIQFALKASF